jgi:hypothetical protein
MSIAEKNNNYLTACAANEKDYEELEQKTLNIMSGRNDDFIKNKMKNAKLKSTVDEYYK